MKINKWVLTPHAVQRIEERKVSIKEITEVIKSPDLIKKQGPKLILAKKFKNRTDNMVACVVLEKKNDIWIIITVMNNFMEK